MPLQALIYSSIKFPCAGDFHITHSPPARREYSGEEWKSVDNGSDIGAALSRHKLPHSRACEGLLRQPPTSARILSPSKQSNWTYPSKIVNRYSIEFASIHYKVLCTSPHPVTIPSQSNHPLITCGDLGCRSHLTFSNSELTQDPVLQARMLWFFQPSRWMP